MGLLSDRVDEIEKDGHIGKVIWPIEKVNNLQSIEKPVDAKVALIADVETTGLDPKVCEVIEVALLEVYFKEVDGKYKILGKGRSFNQLQEPKEPLSPEIVEITGLTDEILKGQKIDWVSARGLYKDCDIVVAHNARFDFSFLKEPIENDKNKKVWLCSVSDIDWKGKGFSSRSQEILALTHGFYYQAHRAITDVEALTHLLSLENNFDDLLRGGKRPIIYICAIKADFSAKDKLKERGYSWNPDGDKCWYKRVESAELAKEEDSWLKSHAYRTAGRSLARTISVHPHRRVEHLSNLLG